MHKVKVPLGPCMSRCSHCLWLLKLAHSLDMIHEVSSVNVLHHKVKPILEKKKE